MLQHLHIKDLAVIASAHIDLHAGMTVITGETGAGKSILLDALNLVLGQRSDSHCIRPGATYTEVSATFDITMLPGAILWLNDLELTGDSPQQCLIRRLLYSNGRSRAFINGSPATIQQLRLLGEHLVQIHGQHQHQLLLKPYEQLRLLDAFGQHGALLGQVKTTYKQWESLQQRKAQLAMIDPAHKALLEYQIAEFCALALKENELTLLYQEHDQLAHAQTYLELAHNTLSLLDSEENSVTQTLVQAKQQLQKIPTANLLKNAKECLENAALQLTEALSEIRAFSEQVKINPERLAQVEKRLEQLHEIARKHKIEPQHLSAHFTKLHTQWEQLTQYDTTAEALDHDIALAYKNYLQYASELSQVRQAAANALAAAVSTGVSQLGMPGAIFTVDLISHSADTPCVSGRESVLFGISANPGHPPLPLHKVASGGELSRVSLALELITAQFLQTPCLIFDEVDVGISGKTGALVGKALSHLSQSVQVLCITHLPQVAAMGDHHLQVIKTQQNGSTQSDILLLDETHRVEEIARLLGGDVTSQAREHAKTLLALT